MRKHKYSLLLGLATVVALSQAAAFAAPTELWFDLDNCAMCQKMTAEKGLMENIEWENYLTAEGMMAITVVAPAYEQAFQNSMTNMEAVGAEMMAGQELYLCGFCQSFGALMMAGANVEYFDTAGGHINLISSQDPVVVEMIHAHGQRTIDEFALMLEAEAAEDNPHDSHDH